MTEFPHVHALLGELLELEAGDGQFPLELLLNMHRAELRQPLLNFATWTVWSQNHDDAARRLRLLLDDDYPQLTKAGIFDATPALREEFVQQELAGQSARLNIVRRHLRELGTPEPFKSIVDALLRDAQRSWVSYAPLVHLYSLSFRVDPELDLMLLEIELAHEPAVQRMIIDVARNL
jgi:hypothetical protein